MVRGSNFSDTNETLMYCIQFLILYEVSVITSVAKEVIFRNFRGISLKFIFKRGQSLC